jgi:hypothetical protein
MGKDVNFAHKVYQFEIKEYKIKTTIFVAKSIQLW